MVWCGCGYVYLFIECFVDVVFLDGYLIFDGVLELFDDVFMLVVVDLEYEGDCYQCYEDVYGSYDLGDHVMG